MSKAEKTEKAASDKPAPEKGKKAAAEAAGESPKKAEKAAPPPPPADPRLKTLKKFAGKFLPKGALRERHKAIMVRWDSGPEHGGVTVEELKTLLEDWRKTRSKPSKAQA